MKRKVAKKMEDRMEQVNLPKKLLKVQDLTFVLPDDFEGGLEEAFHLLTEFIHEAMEKSLRTDKSEDERLAEILDVTNDHKFEICYGIFELDENNEYHLK